jgi:hypothetical protein
VSEFLEAFWSANRNAQFQLGLGAQLNQAGHQDMARFEFIDPLAVAAPLPLPPAHIAVQWRHLVYAALLEQTRMFDIFQRVLFEIIHGERLPGLSQATHRWAHVTEQVFFSHPWSYSVRAVTSTLRPDAGAVRRNAYWRMFAWDLHHGTADGRAYPYVKAEASNRTFSMLFEALLVEVWRGHINRLNFLNANDTDDNAIRTLVRRLQEMLTSRRLSGALSREEYEAVAFAAWLHLVVQYDSPIVVDLNAQSSGGDERLKRIGERVGIAAHARTDSYFQLAAPTSTILRHIENGAVQAAGPAGLYAGAYMNDMLTIITHWSIATGRNVKDPALRQALTGVLTAAAGGAVPGLVAREGTAIVVR